jgi:hypothetical protein
MAEFIYVFLQNDFHCSSPISCLANRFRQFLYPVNPPYRTGKLEARSKGEQSNIARLLDGQAETTLVPCAHTRQAARDNLAALGDKALQQANIAVGDSVDLLGAKLANFLAPEELAAARTTGRRAGGTWSAGTSSRMTGMAAALA